MFLILVLEMFIENANTQETALNHVWMSGLLGDGFGATHGMTRNSLIWVVSRMQLQVDYYPIWYIDIKNLIILCV